jgi:hypothetical protein
MQGEKHTGVSGNKRFARAGGGGGGGGGPEKKKRNFLGGV